MPSSFRLVAGVVDQPDIGRDVMRSHRRVIRRSRASAGSALLRWWRPPRPRSTRPRRGRRGYGCAHALAQFKGGAAGYNFFAEANEIMQEIAQRQGFLAGRRSGPAYCSRTRPCIGVKRHSWSAPRPASRRASARSPRARRRGRIRRRPRRCRRSSSRGTISAIFSIIEALFT